MPCPFTSPKMFWAGPKIYLRTVAVTNNLCQTKRWFAFSKNGFCAGTKVFEEALDAVKFLGCLKKFGPAKNILGPVKGQSISECWEAQKACFCSKSVLDSYALWNSEKMKKNNDVN